MSHGKTKIIINSTNFKSSSDPFRGAAKKYWTQEKGKSFTIYKKDMLSETGDSLTDSGVPFDIIFKGDPTRIEREEFYEFEQTVVLRANQSRINGSTDPATEWQSLVETLVDTEQQIVYEDHSFAIDLPYSNREINLLGIERKVNSANVEPIYNFYIEGYEEQIIKQKTPEAVLPNLYVFALAELEGEEGYEVNDSDLDGLISLGGAIPKEERNMMKTRKRPLNEQTTEKDSNKRYFENYGKAYKGYAKKNKSKLEKIGNRFKTIMLGGDTIESIASFHEKSYTFPMYSQIEFTTDSATYVAEILKSSGLSSHLMNYVVEQANQREVPAMKLTEMHKKIEKLPSKELQSQARTSAVYKTKNMPAFDLLEWWTAFNAAGAISTPGMSGIVISQNQSFDDQHSKIRSTYMQHIYNTIFQSKFRKFIKNYTRSYKSILNGDFSYSETLMYRVDKYIGSPTGTPIQSYYMCNTNEVEIMNILDTQVKYDTEYTYVITAYELVLGTEYFYKDLSTGSRATAENTEYYASFTVSSKPSLKVIEIPIFAERERIIDDPPVAPDIDILSYRAINNRLLFNFMGSVGEYYLHPIFFNKEEQAHYERIRKAQKIEKGEPIRFSSDDPAATFEVFRTTERPKSYLDFRDFKRVSVQTDVSKETIQKASTASYIERLSPNTKYYYIFRSVDIHGHISYPSAVYEVELVDDSGAIYPVIKIVDFEPEIKRTSSKACKKYIHIIPSIAQALVNPEKSGLMNEDGTPIDSALNASQSIQLGFQESPIWGKKFKVRLTSKQTGKKLDLNIRFDQKHVTTEEDYKQTEMVVHTDEDISASRARARYRSREKVAIEEEDLLDLL